MDCLTEMSVLACSRFQGSGLDGLNERVVKSQGWERQPEVQDDTPPSRGSFFFPVPAAL